MMIRNSIRKAAPNIRSLTSTFTWGRNLVGRQTLSWSISSIARPRTTSNYESALLPVWFLLWTLSIGQCAFPPRFGFLGSVALELTRVVVLFLPLPLPISSPNPRFTAMLYSSAKYSAQCNIIALVYLNRLTGRNQLPLTMKNWRGFWVACIVLAQKVWDDKPLRTSSFVQLLPPVTKEQLRALEFRAFVLLDYSAQVKPSIYAKYYFELRSLFGEITGSDPRFMWALKPLSIVQGMRLADRSTRVEQQFQAVVGGGGSPPHAWGKQPMNEQGAEMGKSGGRSAMASPKTFEDVTYSSPASRYVLRL